MAKLTLKSSEYADLTVGFLLDKLMNPSEVVGPAYNEDFNVLMEIIGRKGMRPHLMKYYMNMGSGKRIQYKRIKNVFRVDKKAPTVLIEIQQDAKKKATGMAGLLLTIKDKVLQALK